MNLTNLLDVLADRKLHDRIDFRGLKISIENRKGSVRQGIDKNGNKWKVTMTAPYGYIRMSQGVDGDHIDCFIGPNTNAEKVYIIHRQDPDTKVYDEDKCMLGFASAKAAKSCFLANYDSSGNFGSMDEMSFEDFKRKVLATKDKPVKLSAGGPGSGRKRYACNKNLGGTIRECVTSDGQTQHVGPDCHKKIQKAGNKGYQPPLGGPRLFINKEVK